MPSGEDLTLPLHQQEEGGYQDPHVVGVASTPFAMLRQTSGNLNRSSEPTAKPLSLEWKDISFKIGDKQILSNMTGALQPGRLTAVLGPSGSGKTTLLNVLAGRMRTDAPGMELRGQISAAGTIINPNAFRGNIAYVMQDDRLLPTETCRECLQFSAYLRLPGKPTVQERENFVTALLSTLHLTKCANTLVGSELVKGISGGERKRTSVGVELITNPKMLFLDEPLSGLDSYAAYTLVVALKELAIEGVPILCTVHQPSSEIFDKFDDAVFLHHGFVTYHGPVEQLSKYFERLGFPCKQTYNPADHVMFLLQTESTETICRVKDAWISSALSKELVAIVENSGQEPSTEGLFSLQQNLRPSSSRNCFRQLSVLTKRELRGVLRNKGILGARVVMSLFLAGLYAWLFAGSASNGDDPHSSVPNCNVGNFEYSNCATDFQAHYGTLVSLSISAMMGAAQPILLTFPSERPVFLREYAANQYGVVPYFVSKTLVEMPVVLICQVLTYLLAYWIMGLKGNFVWLVLISWGLGIASSSLALLIGCGVASAQKAIQLAPLALIPQMLFSGLFLPVQKIPTSLRWVKWICPLKYSINLLTQTEFQYIKDSIDECEEKQGTSACIIMMPGNYLRQALIQQQGVEWNDWKFDLTMLAGLFVIFRLIAAILLWRKGRYVY